MHTLSFAWIAFITVSFLCNALDLIFQTCDDDLSLPYDPDPLPNGVVGIPQEIKPKTMTYIVEVGMPSF